MRLLLILLAATAAGCAGFPTIQEERAIFSSGLIGCPAADIQTSAHETMTWTATCRGRVFYCTVAGKQGCTESLKPAGL